MKWKLAVVAVFYLSVLVCGTAPSGRDPRVDGTYATAQARIDRMQTAIAADLTAQAVKNQRL